MNIQNDYTDYPSIQTGYIKKKDHIPWIRRNRVVFLHRDIGCLTLIAFLLIKTKEMIKDLMKFSALFAFMAVFAFVGCNPDPEPEPEPTVTDPPTFEILTTGFHDTITTTDTSSFFSVNVKADKGTGDLKSFTVYESGSKMDLNDLLINDVAASANPTLVVDETDKVGFEWKITFGNQDAFDTRTFTFEVEDVNSKTASDDIVVIVNEPVSIDSVTFNQSGFTFYNNSGPMQGGVDLLDGSSQSTVSGAPHIFDNGLDSGNWKKTISPVSGVTLKSPAASIDFDALVDKAFLAGYYDEGTSITESAPVTTGDIFLAEVNGTKVIFRFDEVVETASDNNDYYKISIKH